MDKKYDHLLVEQGKNQKWVAKKYFATHNPAKPPYTIILPPPNVTGVLHIGHAWNTFIQDTLIRYKKLQGFDVMWVPSMDHAGISTQAKVAENLRNQGIDVASLSRSDFLKYAWEWKRKYADVIQEQWAKLGLALDYDNQRFTLDEAANEAVNKVFIQLYQQGLIYRDVKAVNWDPAQKTALSNIEVINKPTEQKMYHIKYPLTEDIEQFLVVSTTRIETLFSDVAVAVHPEDLRYKHLVGKTIKHPLSQKIIPIIADDYIDIEFGTGAMKVSAHAINDIDIIKKHQLEIVETINKDGFLNDLTAEFSGLERFAAREAIFNKLQTQGAITKVEDITSNVGYSERSGVAIEILVTPQWFVKMDSLARLVLQNLQSNEAVKFFPERFASVTKKWMEEVYDWTISRQLIWGHRIPAWYRGEEIKVQHDSPGEDWIQDPDVLDTWFSSALSPFVFLDWPQSQQKMERYFPTSLLVTGWDIIFFWVARMYFMSLKFVNKIPFKDVLIHGLIRDEQGRKMSKSLGNGIDPMKIIGQYGSDALRAFLLWNSTPGQDIRFSTQKIEAAWNTNNKLWNVARYIHLMPTDNNDFSDIDYWIIKKLGQLQEVIAKHIEKYEFTLIGKEIQKFIFSDLSSWYLELSKTQPNKKAATLVMQNLLILLHPFMPFLTDHLYQELFQAELLESQFNLPTVDHQIDYVDDVIAIVSELRKFREANNLSKKEILEYNLIGDKLANLPLETINNLANARFKINQDTLIRLNNYQLYIATSQELRVQEQQRIEKEIVFLKNEIKRAESMLKNPGFVNKAPQDKIALEQQKLEQFRLKLTEYLKLQNDR
ncbi:valine--tRNA ligase [Candidatus Mycoplasma pogonae]